MARVTVEDCLKRIPNRFFLVHAAAKRVRQLREGSERLIDAPDNEDIVCALREIAAGKVFVTRHYADYEEGPEERDEAVPVTEAKATPEAEPAEQAETLEPSAETTELADESGETDDETVDAAAETGEAADETGDEVDETDDADADDTDIDNDDDDATDEQAPDET